MHGNLDLSGNNLSEEEMKKNFEERQRKEKLKMLDENNRIRRRFANKKEDPKMMEQRRSLPAWNEQEKILDVLKNNQVNNKTYCMHIFLPI